MTALAAVRSTSSAGTSSVTLLCAAAWLIGACSFCSISRGTVPLHSTVDVPEDDVQGPDDGDEVGDHGPLRHLLDGREITERGGTDPHPVRHVPPFTDQVEAEFPLGSLDGLVHFTLRRR